MFGVIKNIFGFRKVRYRGLAKNLHRLEVTAALANLYLGGKRAALPASIHPACSDPLS